jgi:hypothetical protein
MHFFDFKNNAYLDFNGPFLFPYEANIQGLSVCPGIIFAYNRKYSIRVESNVRKDAISLYRGQPQLAFGRSIRGDDTTYSTTVSYPLVQHKEWIIDLNTSIHYRLDNNIFGIGFSTINFGKTIFDENDRLWNIAFNTYNLHYERIIKERYGIEFLVHYVAKGDYFFNRNHDFISYNLKLNYHFGRKEKTK